MVDRPQTLGGLRESGWQDRSVKDEIRRNLIERIAAGDSVFPNIIGYEKSVIPALERAILAGHDMILLGERGQAKTRLIRSLVGLLDPFTPAVDGCEIHDSPLRPVCAPCRARLADEGDELAVRWVAAAERFGEKLATPDTAVADLIGDVDPIRVAEGRYLSDETVIHYGLVPRTHRGVFSINELPDLPPRIQVSLLNILEERDVQIRGFRVRLPLDVMLVATANPEDYTNRGRIITPLKDRFGSEIRTHYPHTRADEIAVMRQEASPPPGDIEVSVPAWVEDVIAEFSQRARQSGQINQRSGVSVRLSIANLETVRASAMRRALRGGEGEAVPRVTDLGAVFQSTTGRIEFEGFDEGREEEILQRLLAQSVLEVFREYLIGYDFQPLLDHFEQGGTIDVGELVPSRSLVSQIDGLDLAQLLLRLGMRGESPGDAASALELALEGLHLTRRLNRTGSVYGIEDRR